MFCKGCGTASFAVPGVNILCNPMNRVKFELRACRVKENHLRAFESIVCAIEMRTVRKLSTPDIVAT
jgi:hypothetical protein